MITFPLEKNPILEPHAEFTWLTVLLTKHLVVLRRERERERETKRE